MLILYDQVSTFECKECLEEGKIPRYPMGIFMTANLVVQMVVPYLFLERVGSKIFLLLGTTAALPLLRRASNFSRDMNERNFKFRNRENPLDFFSEKFMSIWGNRNPGKIWPIGLH